MRSKILIIDDEPVLRNSLEIAMTASGLEVISSSSGEEGLELFHKENPDLILLDHWLPGINGDEVLRLIRQNDEEIPVIIMTAQGSIELAVNSMKMGAFDFLVKPFDLEQLEALVQKCLERTRLKKEVAWLRAQYQDRFPAGGIIAVSRDMRDALVLAEKVARSADTTVLIEGETGTGKELLAEYVHFLSPRASFPFIPLNCGAIPYELVESELFGYEKGAFTGAWERKRGTVEAAEKGTLFLDEVGDLPPAAQVKILRFLEEKEYFKVGGIEKKRADVRIIAATNKDLAAEVGKGKFRDDLYFRINVIKINIPALRTRKEDILPLFSFFMERFNEQFNKRFVRIAPGAQEKLLSYAWPGNIREVKNTAERIILLEKGDTILEKHLSSLSHPAGGTQNNAPQPAMSPQSLALADLEQDYIRQALRIKKGNKLQAAKILGITRSALLYRMEKYGIKAD